MRPSPERIAAFGRGHRIVLTASKRRRTGMHRGEGCQRSEPGRIACMKSWFGAGLVRAAWKLLLVVLGAALIGVLVGVL